MIYNIKQKSRIRIKMSFLQYIVWIYHIHLFDLFILKLKFLGNNVFPNSKQCLRVPMVSINIRDHVRKIHLSPCFLCLKKRFLRHSTNGLGQKPYAEMNGFLSQNIMRPGCLQRWCYHETLRENTILSSYDVGSHLAK